MERGENAERGERREGCDCGMWGVVGMERGGQPFWRIYERPLYTVLRTHAKKNKLRWESCSGGAASVALCAVAMGDVAVGDVAVGDIAAAAVV